MEIYEIECYQARKTTILFYYIVCLHRVKVIIITELRRTEKFHWTTGMKITNHSTLVVHVFYLKSNEKKILYWHRKSFSGEYCLFIINFFLKNNEYQPIRELWINQIINYFVTRDYLINQPSRNWRG